MKVNIVPIGNSKGIRLPKALLKLCHIKEKVDIEVTRGLIVIKPIRQKARENWEESFKIMHENKDDTLVIDDSVDLEMENWEW